MAAKVLEKNITPSETDIDYWMTNSIKSFSTSISWLKDILKGVRNLHIQDLCFLDLKINNGLIKTACDFGSLTCLERG